MVSPPGPADAAAAVGQITGRVSFKDSRPTHVGLSGYVALNLEVAAAYRKYASRR